MSYQNQTTESFKQTQRPTKVFAKAGLDNVTSTICKHQQRFGLGVQFSALVVNFTKIFSIGHLYQTGQSMNSLPSQILERWLQYATLYTTRVSMILLRNYGIFTKNKSIMVLVLKKGASKREIESIEKKLKNKSGIDVMKYCGKIKLKEDALLIQKSLRNEWQ